MGLKVGISPSAILKLNASIVAFNELSRGKAAQVVQNHSRAFINDMVKYTPPKNKGQGEAKVKADIQRAVTPFDSKFTDSVRNKDLSDRLNEIRKDKDIPALRAILRNVKGPMHSSEIVAFSPELHLTTRIRGNALRVTRQNKITFDVTPEKDYIKEVQSRVGTLKAAWGQAALAIGTSVPHWVSRNIPRANTSIEVMFSGDRPHLYVSIASNANPLLRKLVDAFLPSRVERMTKDLVFQINYIINQRKVK